MTTDVKFFLTSDSVQQALDTMLEHSKRHDGYGLEETTADTSVYPFLSILEVQRSTEALQTILDTMASTINDKVALLQQRRNALAAPIHRLPNEIFVIIVQLALAEVPERRIRRLTAFQTVSTKWRDMISASPCLWPVVQFNDLHRLALKYSATVPLDVRFEQNFPTANERLDRYLSDVGHHASRWRSFMTNCRAREALPYLYEAGGALISLNLESEGTANAPHLDLIPFESLENLVIHNIDLNWAPLGFKTLQTLRITGTLPACLPTLIQLLGALRACKELQSFVMDGQNYWGYQRTLELEDEWLSLEEDVIEPVMLPRLEELRIVGVVAPIYRILNALRAPSLAKLVIHNTSALATPILLSILERSLDEDSLLHSVVADIEPKIWVSDAKIVLTEKNAFSGLPNEARHFKLHIVTPILSFDQGGVWQTWRQLRVLPFATSSKPLHLSVRMPTSTIEATDLGLQEFWSLRSLELLLGQSPLSQTLELLSQKPECGHGSYCPSMKTLRLLNCNASYTNDTFNQEIVQLLSSRTVSTSPAPTLKFIASPKTDGCVPLLDVLDRDGRVFNMQREAFE